MKAAYLAAPTPYGLFTLYRNLRAGLEGQGIELRWVGHGQQGVNASKDPAWESERARGEVVGPDLTNKDDLGKALVRHLVERHYDAVFINLPQEHFEMNVVRYLPGSIVRIMLVGAMGGGVYRLCRSIRQYVHATVGLCPRTRDDLVKDFGFDPSRISVGGEIDLRPTATCRRGRHPNNCGLSISGECPTRQRDLHAAAHLSAARRRAGSSFHRR